MRPYHVAEIDSHVRKMIAAHLVTNYQGGLNPTVSDMKRYVPIRMDEFKRIKIHDRDEMVRTADLLNGVGKRCRDNTFIKVSCINIPICLSHVNIKQYTVQVDKNTNDPRAPVVLEWKEFYGRLVRILAFSLAANCPYQDATATPPTHIVTLIAPVPPRRSRNRLGMQFYKGDKLETPKIVDLACVQCVVGRIKDRDMWALVDRGAIAPLLESHKDVFADFED